MRTHGLLANPLKVEGDGPEKNAKKQGEQPAIREPEKNIAVGRKWLPLNHAICFFQYPLLNERSGRLEYPAFEQLSSVRGVDPWISQPLFLGLDFQLVNDECVNHHTQLPLNAKMSSNSDIWRGSGSNRLSSGILFWNPLCLVISASLEWEPTKQVHPIGLRIGGLKVQSADSKCL